MTRGVYRTPGRERCSAVRVPLACGTDNFGCVRRIPGSYPQWHSVSTDFTMLLVNSADRADGVGSVRYAICTFHAERIATVNETYLTLVGRVASDLREGETANGVKRVSFRVASNERRFDRASRRWVDGDRLYLNVTCWRRLATGVSSSLTKGDPVVVTGRVRTREYELDGQRRWSTEMDASSVGPDLSRCSAIVQRFQTGNGEGSPWHGSDASEGPARNWADDALAEGARSLHPLPSGVG